MALLGNLFHNRILRIIPASLDRSFSPLDIRSSEGVFGASSVTSCRPTAMPPCDMKSIQRLFDMEAP